MLNINISEADIVSVIYKIIHDPDPDVRKKMMVVLLKAFRIAHGLIAFFVQIHSNSVTNYLRKFNEGGLDLLLADNRHGPVSGLAGFEQQAREAFKKVEPANSVEAAAKLSEITGRHVSPRTAIRWMRSLGMIFVKPVVIPSKADHERQFNFLTFTLMPLLKLAKMLRCVVYFVDAAHFVQSASAAPRWAFQRGVLQALSGRSRHNILAALNPIDKRIICVCEEAYVNAKSVIALLEKIRQAHKRRVVWIVLDNAAYQHCDLVRQKAKELGINLLFLPPYSPNLNLIERLWRLVRKEVLHNKYYKTFPEYKAAINNFINDLNEGKFADKMESLISLKFQLFENSQIAVA
jgi:transposase